MEAQNNITEQMKEAARNAESKSFPGMESVWEKVTARLDEKEEEKKVIPFFNYKKIAAAAAGLILLGLGTSYFLANKDAEITVAVNRRPTDSTRPTEAVVAPKRDGNTGVTANTNTEYTKPMKPATSPKVGTGKLADTPPLITVTHPKNVMNNQASLNVPKVKNPEIVGGTVAVPPKPTIEEPTIAAARNGERKIAGTVTDEDGEPIVGALVRIKNRTSDVTLTDADGRYEITIPAGDSIKLILNSYNLESQEVVAQNNMTYKLKSSSTALNEIEVYGQKLDKRSSTGAVAVVTAKEIAKRPVTNGFKPVQGSVSSATLGNNGYSSFKNNYNINSASNNSSTYNWNGSNNENSGKNNTNANMNAILDKSPTVVTAADIAKRPVLDIIKSIEGSTPGIQVSSGGGQPSQTPDIQMRGPGSISSNQSPLIVVNGAPYAGSLVSINPSDVETMTFLKDAPATSLYGARGANGVIIVTTKNSANKKHGKKWSIKNWFRKSKPTTMVTPQAAAPNVETIAQPEVATQEDYDSFVENPFETPKEAPLSTFSIDVDKAAYSNVRRFINQGQPVPKDAVRIEEMINYFKYQYPQPKEGNPFSINTEYSEAPWNPKHKLLKIGLQGKEIPTAQLPSSNFVFLIDVSGSMDEPNKLPLLKASFKMLVAQMRKQDRVAIVVYAGSAGLVLPATSGAEKQTILDALDRLRSGGSTAGGAGIELAYKIAQEHFIKDGNNRVILATDGDFNVGASSNTDMQTLIEEKRKSNIFLTCLGYGMGNYKDSKMEVLADKGNGNYAYIDNMQEANKFLVKEFSGSMYSIAKDVKIQIEFNPEYVQAYRLIGYENRKLKAEDFANDAIDAGELGSGHTVTALYEIIPTGIQSEFSKELPDLKYNKATTSDSFNNELGTVKFRYKKPDGDKSVEMVQVIHHEGETLSHSSKDFKLAAAVAWFGLKLRDSKLIADKDKAKIIQLAKEGVANDVDGYKAAFVNLVEIAP